MFSHLQYALNANPCAYCKFHKGYVHNLIICGYEEGLDINKYFDYKSFWR